MKFIVLCSSRGTTFQSVIDAMNNGSLEAECVGLVTDDENKACIDKAKEAGLPYSIAEKVDDKKAFEKNVEDAITKLGKPDVIALMGWMWILSPEFVQKYSGKMLNVHPALLPKYGGEGMYGPRVHRAVLESGDTESGMSIHVVDSGVDTGKILLQKTCPVENDDTEETLQKRVQELEKEWYPKLLQMIQEGKVAL